MPGTYLTKSSPPVVFEKIETLAPWKESTVFDGTLQIFADRILYWHRFGAGVVFSLFYVEVKQLGLNEDLGKSL